jgi:hypothetical protein
MDYCDGCIAPCTPEKTGDPSGCPCVNCIVKMMCFDSCDEWEDWFHLYGEVCYVDVDEL